MEPMVATAAPSAPRTAVLAKASSTKTEEPEGVVELGGATVAAELGGVKVVGMWVTVANAEAAAQGAQGVATEAGVAKTEAVAMAAAAAGV